MAPGPNGRVRPVMSAAGQPINVQFCEGFRMPARARRF
jgi:hypothetical protein